MSANYLLTKFVGFGIRELTQEENDFYCQLENSKNTSKIPILPNPTDTFEFNSEFELRVFSSGCYYYDTILKNWKSNGVEVTKETNTTHTFCNATHLTGLDQNIFYN